MQSDLSQHLLPKVIDIVKQAGKVILSFYNSEILDVLQKPDNTPITNADIAAHQTIVTELSTLNDWPILSEEGELPAYALRSQWTRYWLIDPLDGTRGFINGLDEFTVNIAVIEGHRPVLGVMYAPVHQTLFFASQGEGAFLLQEREQDKPTPIYTASRSLNQLRFVVGKYHRLRRMQPILDQFPQATLLRLNSSLKFAAIAQGKADVYARFGPINEWDTAAGQCILEEAGGKVVDFTGARLQYNASESLLCPPFLAVGSDAYIHPLIRAC